MRKRSYECGNVTSEDTYHDEKCPHCKKEIKAQGVGFSVLNDLFICEECDERFADPQLINLCLICNNEFKIENAKWVSGRLYVRK